VLNEASDKQLLFISRKKERLQTKEKFCYSKERKKNMMGK
jgi:hypothetical protein